jgi:hypothetical protein
LRENTSSSSAPPISHRKTAGSVPEIAEKPFPAQDQIPTNSQTITHERERDVMTSQTCQKPKQAPASSQEQNPHEKPKAIKLGKAILSKADKGEPFVSMEESRVDRISEFSK